VLVARWLGFPAGAGQHFLLDTGTLSVLGQYRGIPAVKIWNGPLPDQGIGSSITASPDASAVESRT